MQATIALGARPYWVWLFDRSDANKAHCRTTSKTIFQNLLNFDKLCSTFTIKIENCWNNVSVIAGFFFFWAWVTEFLIQLSYMLVNISLDFSTCFFKFSGWPMVIFGFASSLLPAGIRSLVFRLSFGSSCPNILRWRRSIASSSSWLFHSFTPYNSEVNISICQTSKHSW